MLNRRKMTKRKDLQSLEKRKSFLKDENRPKAVDSRHSKGYLTTRENINNLCDADTFLEYGSLVIAGQRSRRTLEDLIEKTPGDGLVAGIGEVNGEFFSEEKAKCLVMSYDYTVLAGTQGFRNHKKTDRLLEIALKGKLPIVFFLEGGGGRSGDVDYFPLLVGGLDLNTFAKYARLNGKVPRIAIVNGYCFAGNAALAGCSDVIIATKTASLGMGGPAMIEGGGLGVFQPEEVGPVSFQVPNGVVDVLVEDEKMAVHAAKQYLSYFQGSITYNECEDQEQLRNIVPEERRMAYDMRKLINILCDKNSVLELRPFFGKSIITALVRVDGRPMGVIANNLKHLAGALDSDSSDKIARFLQLCDSFGLPVLSLVDVPGFMVGPNSEKTALVRHASRIFTVAANVDIPIYTVVTRKGYGLGAMALAGGGFFETSFTVSWPTGEFGGMGLEGAVKLGFSKELNAVKDEAERTKLHNKLLNDAYEQGSAMNAAAVLEIDEVIDPMDTRKWIINANKCYPEQSYKTRNGRYIDTW
jgi:acetyl-CoA carboxylase carboxyltransferase component